MTPAGLRRVVVHALLALLLVTGCATTSDHGSVSLAPVEVSLRVVLTRAKQCVGPRQLDETDLERVPASELKLILRRGTENSADVPAIPIVTDAGGVARVAVSPGDYCLLEDWKEHAIDWPLDPYIDELCQKQLWKACDAVLHLPDAQGSDVVLPRSCWGNCYFGPHP